MTPTSRTLAWLREQGCTAEVVERHNSFSGRKHDLFGFVDIVALDGRMTIGVQATSAANVGARVAKIRESDKLTAVLSAGWSVWVVGWRKYKVPQDGKYWRPVVRRIEDAD